MGNAPVGIDSFDEFFARLRKLFAAAEDVPSTGTIEAGVDGPARGVAAAAKATLGDNAALIASEIERLRRATETTLESVRAAIESLAAADEDATATAGFLLIALDHMRHDPDAPEGAS